MKNNKGFTLIEVLAVIIIIAVLALITIPNINRLIEDSKKRNFISDAKTYINIFRTGISSREYVTEDGAVCSIPKAGYYNAIELNQLSSENGTSKSPWGYNYTGYVLIGNKVSAQAPRGSNKVGKLVYYFIGSDTAKNGIHNLIAESDLNTKYVVNKSAINEKTTTDKTIIDKIKGHQSVNEFSYGAICKDD